VFLGAPEFTVLAGRDELGSVDSSLLSGEVTGDRRLLLGGRSWRVVQVDWRRRRCQVEPADGGGKVRWFSRGWAGTSFDLARAARTVLLGTDQPSG
jgi:ATP-dependent Lhr-like helicase